MNEQTEIKAEKKKSNKKLYILLAVVVAIIAIVLGNKISDSIDSKKTGGPLDIQTYFSDFDSNAMLAEKKYIGNRYSITGKIKEIQRTLTTTVVWINVSEFDYRLNFQEKFEFIPYDEDDISNLKVGQTITATGTLIKLPSYGGGTFENSVFYIE